MTANEGHKIQRRKKNGRKTGRENANVPSVKVSGVICALEKSTGGGVLSAVLCFSPGGRADLSCEEAKGIADSV